MPLKGFLYRNQLQVIAELDGFGGLVSQFVYGTKANVPDYMIRGGERYQLIHDQVGSVRFVVHAQYGYVAQELVYDEFGNVVMDTSPGFQPFGFAGGLYDSDIGLVRFGARDYDPFTGRWTAKDPIGFNGRDTNLYGYVLADPVNLVDPDGRIVIAPVAIGAAAGFVYGAAGGLLGSLTNPNLSTSQIIANTIMGSLGGAAAGAGAGALGGAAIIGGVTGVFSGAYSASMGSIEGGFSLGGVLGGALGGGIGGIVGAYTGGTAGIVASGVVGGSLGVSLGLLGAQVEGLLNQPPAVPVTPCP